MRTFVILLVGVMLLAACGGGSSQPTPSATSAAPAAPSAAIDTTARATAATAARSAVTMSATPPSPSTAASSTSTADAESASATTVVGTVALPATATSVATAGRGSTVTTAATAAPTAAPDEATAAPATEAATIEPTAESTQVAARGQPTQDQLNGALLAASDLPAGWSALPLDPSSDAEPAGFCQSDQASGIAQIRAYGAFEELNQGLYLQETLAGFSPGDAAAWMDWVKPTVDCSQVEDDSVDPPVVYQVAPLDFPPLGDQMLAYRLSVTDPTLGEIAYDIVYSRVGNCVATIANLALGVADTDLTQSTLQSAVNRARAVCG